MRARILSASAGAGKTYALAYKFVHDVIKHYPDKPYLYRAILAVTFTNKAAGEMKRRVRSLIGQAYDTSLICTYHGFCVRVLREDIEKIFLQEQ